MKLAALVNRLGKVAWHADSDYLRRQVRYWTATGLVDEDTKLRDQPRRHRDYDTRHLYRAALLLELAKYGIPRWVMAQVVEQIRLRVSVYHEKYGSDPFEDAAKGTGVLFICYLLGGSPGVSEDRLLAELRIERVALDEIKMPFTASWITIDLNRVLERLS